MPAAAVSVYYEKIHHCFAPFFATRIPSLHAKLGDYGTLRKNKFVARGNIFDQNVVSSNFKDPEFGRTSDSLRYDSGGSVKAKFEVSSSISSTKGDAIGGKFSINFDGGSEVFFYAGNCRLRMIKNIERLETELINSTKKGTWNVDHVIACGIIESNLFIAAIASGKNASLDFGIKSPIPTGINDLDNVSSLLKANAALEFQLEKQENIGFSHLETAYSTPLVELWKLRRVLGFIGQPKLDPAIGNVANKSSGSSEFRFEKITD